MADLIIKALLFVVMFALIIIVHEGGHFLLGKKNNIGVREFSIGFGPTLFGVNYHGTKYALHLFPFGGACMFEGMDGSYGIDEDDDEDNDDIDVAVDEREALADEALQYSEGTVPFPAAGVWARIATVVAGPVGNFLLAFFLSLFIIGSIGYDKPEIAGVIEGYPAATAGLQEGDVIKSIGGHKIVVYRDISAYTMFFREKSAEVVYERDGKDYSTVLTPLYSESDGRYLFGIAGYKGRVKANPLEVVRYSVHEVYYWIDITYKSLGMMFQGRVKADDLAGPVGVAKVVGDTYDEAKPDGIFYIWLNMLNLTILLSANLGVMNLLPIPALDGGRLVFLVIEVIRGKPIDQEKEAMIHFAGIMVILALMVFVMFNDIGRFFRH